MNSDIIYAVLSALGEHSIINFINYFLTSPVYANHPSKVIFIAQFPDLLRLLVNNSSTNKVTTDFSVAFVTDVLMGEVALTRARGRYAGYIHVL